MTTGPRLLLWLVLSRAEALQGSGINTALGPLLVGRYTLL